MRTLTAKKMTCNFNTPKTFNGGTPSSTDDFWQYSELACTSTQTELIMNDENSNSFFLNKSISYGDYVIITFLFLFLVFSIVNFLIDWFIPKKLDWKQH